MTRVFKIGQTSEYPGYLLEFPPGINCLIHPGSANPKNDIILVPDTKSYALNIRSTAMLREFREFIARGNVLDLAVAVIIGGAFGAIINSLVNDIIMPLVGILVGGIDFSGLSLTVGEAVIRTGTSSRRSLPSSL